jgi:tetratricopeptide (TPR) repeat protein
MLRRSTPAALALALLATHVHAGEGTQKLALPGKSWSLLIDLPNFEQDRIETRPDGKGVMIQASHRDYGVVASVFLESRPDLDSTEACKEDYWSRSARAPLPKSGIKFGAQGSLATVHWKLGNEGDAFQQRHVNAYLYRDGVCADVHLSKFPAAPSDEKAFAAVLDTLRFSDAQAPRRAQRAEGERSQNGGVPAAPALQPSASARAAFKEGMAAYGRKDLPTAERHLREAATQVPTSYMAHTYLAHALFYQDRFAEAIAEYERARTIGAPPGNDQQTLERVLNDNLGMALALGGRMADSKTHFEAAIRKDPGYALYHYNLACSEAELGNLDAALAGLEQAYKNRANVVPGGNLPDPLTDSSFKPYLQDPRFKALVARYRR